MTKGEGCPRARARWLYTQTSYTRYQQPCYIAPFILAVYIVVIDGLPVPIAILPDDQTLGWWRYCPGTGAIRWEGDWHAGLYNGRWAIEKRMSYDHLSESRLSMIYEPVGLPPDGVVGEWMKSGRNDQCVQPHFEIDVRATATNILVGGWLIAECDQAIGSTYAVIKAAGIPNWETQPATWNAPDDPW